MICNEFDTMSKQEKDSHSDKLKSLKEKNFSEDVKASIDKKLAYVNKPVKK